MYIKIQRNNEDVYDQDMNHFGFLEDTIVYKTKHISTSWSFYSC